MKLICIGRNYAKHISELHSEKPEHPVVFMKPDSSVLLKNNPFIIPAFSDDVHHEVEILVKIKKVGKHIQPKFAHNYYEDIGLGIDFTARDVQNYLKDKGLPWEKAKGFDGAAVIGEHWFPKTKFQEVNAISFRLEKNKEIVQAGSTSEMLWKIDELIAYVSQYFTLKIGDIIFTGTPSGVGPVEEGDVLEGFIEESSCFSIQVK
ncbi:fumarylacetoacetate hydrolase family protein [Psychroflexus sp. CAK57W]|uniref:fumarylacetoacetate hydrolase family protein n=1 Tax=Psychroflexus curvus TaxID=2873595 RepID=UPI001CC9E453|nr:fumarylacetoacetate hydrolase family protein [Psychroflexus curvus]MBZ9787767.1 fumarylacetoacetate hydrolase family protein [Psychroflexus curvus]